MYVLHDICYMQFKNKTIIYHNLYYNNGKIYKFTEAKLRESKTKYTMRDINVPLVGEIVQDDNNSSSTDVEKTE